MKKALIIPVVLLLLISELLPFDSSTHAAGTSPVKLTSEERTWIDLNPDKLALFYNTGFPPVEFVSPDGSFAGLGADVVSLVEKRLGATFHKKPSKDWKQSLSAMESGECAIAPTIVRTAEREQFAFFTPPYMTVPVVIIGTRALKNGKTLDDLTGLRVAVVTGHATENYLRSRANGRFEVAPMPNARQALRATSFGQVDAWVENLGIAAFFIEKEGIPNLRVIGSTDFVYALSIGVSRKYPLLFSAVEKALADIPRIELENIRKRWISLEINSSISPETKSLIALATGFIALLLLGLLLISLFLRLRLKEQIANLKTAQQELVDQAELLRLATESTQAGVWDCRPDTQTIFVSEQWWSMLGYKPEARAIPLTEFLTFVYPENLPEVKRAFEKYIAEGGQDRFEFECRLRRADGGWCWALSKGKAVAWNEKRIPSRIIGLDLNIQSIKEAQEKITQSEARFRMLFKMAPLPLAHISR